MKRNLLTLAIASVLLVNVWPTASGGPKATESNDRIVLENEHVIVQLQGKKPMLEVHDAANASRGYKIFLQRLVETTIAAGLTGGEMIASFNLASAENWTAVTNSDPEGVHIMMHREGAIDARGPFPLPSPIDELGRQLSPRNASVTIVFHLYAHPRTIGMGDDAVNVTTYEVKFDLHVERWDWVDRGDVLALEFLIVERDNRSAARPHNRTADENRTISVEQNGTPVGWFGWLPTASATTNETTETVNVTHHAQGRGSSGEEHGARHLLLYDAPGFDRLQHDPSAGVVPEGTTREELERASVDQPRETPMPAILALVAAPAAAMLLAGRRPRR